MVYEHSFDKSGHNPEIIESYKAVSKIVKSYGLEVPAFWKNLQ
jgi:hypothetical protein